VTPLWQSQYAPHDFGLWFVKDDEHETAVLAPPGTHVLAPRYRPPAARSSTAGWRLATWMCAGNPDLRIDSAAPETVVAMKTLEVLDLLDDQWAHQVRMIMVDQLQQAMAFGVTGVKGPPIERSAQLGAVNSTLIREELEAAFPEEDWSLPAADTRREDVPDTYEALAEEMDLPLHESHQPNETPQNTHSGHASARRTVEEAVAKKLLDALTAIREQLSPRVQSVSDWLSDRADPSSETHTQPVAEGDRYGNETPAPDKDEHLAVR
jgi:hypothetical protein